MPNVIRVSIMRCQPDRFDHLKSMVAESETELRGGLEAMPGLIAYYAGADAATSSMTNTSVWDSLEHARQVDSFQPMLVAGKRLAAEGATFERPIMNYETLWTIDESGS